ncbi:MAG: hypothetical protein NVSMB64_15500 [Candidatus Velthaea sp.]
MKKASKPDGLARINKRAKQVDVMLDLKAQIDAGLAHSNALVAKLTPTQKSRALATVAGATPSEIAKAEGVSKQSVSESIAAPSVRMALRDLVSEMVVKELEATGLFRKRA